ncbi:MAG: VTT domain-containing protein [Porphyromonas sp.]|nr:VTT domain-containing protein [Porphyromonas sp.]
MEFLIEHGYLGVFVAAFLAATILPFSSEVVLSGVLLAGADYWMCIAAATIGNWLGGMSCYWLGAQGKKEWIIKYLRVNPLRLEKITNWLQGRGSWMGFWAFLPGVGDFFAIALGLLRANVWSVALFMLTGKLVRYLVWQQIVDFFVSLF